MPIEIRELIIKAQVRNEQDTENTRQTTSAPSDSDKEKIVQTCVEQVLQILEDKKAR